MSPHAEPLPPVRPSWAFMRGDLAHWIALGLGSGLSPKAPGTAGTLAAWLGYVLLAPWLSLAGWLLVIALGTLIGIWACTRTAQHLRVPDPGAVVWDEVLAFWLLLALIAPSGWMAQLVAFALFRFFDAVKPGPVGWADRLFKPQCDAAGAWRITTAQGLGILLDDFVAAACAWAVFIAGRAAWAAWS